MKVEGSWKVNLFEVFGLCDRCGRKVDCCFVTQELHFYLVRLSCVVSEDNKRTSRA